MLYQHSKWAVQMRSQLWRNCYQHGQVLCPGTTRAPSHLQDTPDGDYRDLEKKGKKQRSKPWKELGNGLCNYRMWGLAACYAYTFGVEVWARPACDAVTLCTGLKHCTLPEAARCVCLFVSNPLALHSLPVVL